MTTIVLGLAGLRQVGKSHFADRLVEKFGFVKIHPFNGGKAACRAYYEHIGISPQDAWEMTDGKLKDTPCEKLPGGVPSRFFMEKFGKFMGVEMGPAWTLGKEIERAKAKGIGDRLLIESIVYEDHVVRAEGGFILRVERPGVEPTPGLETDAYTATMLVDGVYLNDKPTLEEYYQEIDAYIENVVLAADLQKQRELLEI